MLPWVTVQTVGVNMYQINYLLKALKEKEEVLEVCSFIDFVFQCCVFFYVLLLKKDLNKNSNDFVSRTVELFFVNKCKMDHKFY